MTPVFGFLVRTLVLAAIMFWSATARAQVVIEVTGGQVKGLPIAVVPFTLVGAPSGTLQPADIIESDLRFSGRFDNVPRAQHLEQPDTMDAVEYKNWRLLKVEALVVGRMINLGNDQYEIRFQLIDVFREKQLIGQKSVVSAKRLRKTAHQLSNTIYETLLGQKGAFDTRVVFVAAEGAGAARKFFLRVADADGWNPRTVLESTQPILSPAWSPDGRKLAYVSFEKKRSIIYIQDLRTSERMPVAEFDGLNSAPSWSPDGRRLAMTLSRDGNPEIYIYDIHTAELHRLTRHTAIDTEPSWSPDGSSIIFTSGRAGKPQIYQIAVAGGSPRRLTFQGDYNAGASFAPDGKSIALITNSGNGYNVGVYSFHDQQIRTLTSTRQDESPTFAPNGAIIMFATRKGGRNVLATVSVNGQSEQTLEFQQGDAREPAWSPFNRKP